jgi:hypothetical protein
MIMASGVRGDGCASPDGRKGMAVPETDVARIRKWADSRVPAHVRDQLWMEVEVDTRAVTVFECHPSWNPDLVGPEPMRSPVARFRYVAARKEWELYWCDSNEAFRRYDLPASPQVAPLLAELDADPFCLFWG